MNMTTLNVMPLRMRLDREKKKSGLTFETVQQDYLLSWVLSGLYEHPSLNEKLIFKGGTALKNVTLEIIGFLKIWISLSFHPSLKGINF